MRTKELCGLCVCLFLFQNLFAFSNSAKPAGFIENKGQIMDQLFASRNDIQYALQKAGISLFIGPGHLHYQWSKPEGEQFSMYRMDVTLEGADNNAVPVAIGTQDEKVQYYAPGHREGIFVRTCEKIVYNGIYPGIDWVLYLQQGQLKYDFIVHPGARISDIRLRYDGATSLSLKDGALQAGTPLGNIIEQKPYTYSKETGRQLPSSFILDGNTLSFQVAQHSGEIVIDPILDWATYYGGIAQEEGMATAVDPAGNVYLTGTTNSSANIATTGSFQTTFGGNIDAFIVKFNAYGQRIWATYYGGSNNEKPYSITTDKNGNVYIAGETAFSGFIGSSSSHQATFGGGTYDAFLTKFTSAGSLVWDSYYGGSADDLARAVKCDTSGNVYIAGATFSTTNISTSGSHQPTFGGGFSNDDGFLVKFDPSGVRQWGTYYGGTLPDRINAIDIDNAANVYVTGSAISTTGIATSGSHQPVIGGSFTYNAFLTKFNTSGVRQWGTYYGGGGEVGQSVAIDTAGNIYMAGFAGGPVSADVTSGSHQTTFGGLTDGLLVKFNNAGQRLWGTYYGGSAGEEFRFVGCDRTGYVYAAGVTQSSNNISTPGSFQTSPGGGGYIDAFFVRFTSGGTRLWGSYFGGLGSEDLQSAATDPSGNIYLPFSTITASGISTSGSFQPSYGGSQDAFLAKFLPDTAVSAMTPSFAQLCAGGLFAIPYTTTISFAPSNVFTAELSDGSGNFNIPLSIGSVTAQTSGIIYGTLPVITPGNGYRVRVRSTNPYYISKDNGTNIRIDSFITPAVTISVSPDSTVVEGTSVTFTANMVNGGAIPLFQWLNNGISIPAATSSSYTTSTLQNNDVISVRMINTELCTTLDTVYSNAITMIMLPTSINLSPRTSQLISVYPNPSSGQFTITGTAVKSSKLRLEVIDPLGRTILSQYIFVPQGTYTEKVMLNESVADGLYRLRMIGDDYLQILSIVKSSK